jgi:hypothetical protein
MKAYFSLRLFLQYIADAAALSATPAEDLTNDNFTVEESRLLIFFPLREKYI